MKQGIVVYATTVWSYVFCEKSRKRCRVRSHHVHPGCLQKYSSSFQKHH